jgi:aspartyl-tRNA(Asn)/glutamyl-tRNA(Gln) amidotransferase subunit C
MSVSKQDVEHVAKLARLGLSEEEKELFTSQLNQILGYAESINKLDTEKVPPTSHAIPMNTLYREDKVIPCENTKDILKNAPEQNRGMFRVPRILE